MRNLSLITKLFIMAILGLGLALYGCPPTTTSDDDDDNDDMADDDDSQTDDDDSQTDDDDDDSQTDDDDSYAGYFHDQDMAGVPASNQCDGCEFTFDITYTTISQTGTCFFCWDFDDGTYTLGYDADYMYGSYGPYEIVFYNYGGSWVIWYMAYGQYGGHDVATFWMDDYYGYNFYQYGYWDIAGGNMTGYASTTES